MTLLVKICGLREARHVDAAVDAGADAVGFVFADSVRQVAPADAAAICVNVPSQIKRVAVMLHPANDEWQVVLQDFQPDVLQADAKDFAALEVPGSIEQWPVFREGGAPPRTTGMFLFEGVKSGQGEAVDWLRAAAIAKNGKMILAGGLTTHNIAAAIAMVRPFGVDVSSAVESAPGQKDIRLISEFVIAARAAEKDQ